MSCDVVPSVLFCLRAIQYIVAVCAKGNALLPSIVLFKRSLERLARVRRAYNTDEFGHNYVSRVT